MDTSDIPYGRLGKGDLILRDHLAGQRTCLANERTLLAYVRTALTLLIGGLSFIQFFEHAGAQVIGWVFLPSSAAMGLAGLLRYRKMQRLLRQMGELNSGRGNSH